MLVCVAVLHAIGLTAYITLIIQSFIKIRLYAAAKAERDGRLWQCLDMEIDWETVRNIADPIMTRFTARTNGTCKSPRYVFLCGLLMGRALVRISY